MSLVLDEVEEQTFEMPIMDRPSLRTGTRLFESIGSYAESVQVLFLADGLHIWIFRSESCFENQIDAGRSAPFFHDLHAVRSAPLRLSLLVSEQVIFIAFQLGEHLYEDADYNFHLVPDEFRPALTDAFAPINFDVALVDAKTGLVKAVRKGTLPTEFAAALRRAVSSQAEQTLDEADYHSQVELIRELVPTTREIALIADVHADILA